ncbi:hypothetical protein [Sodalis sp. RH22]
MNDNVLFRWIRLFQRDFGGLD